MDSEPLRITAKCSFERSGNITLKYAESESLKIWYVSFSIVFFDAV